MARNNNGTVIGVVVGAVGVGLSIGGFVYAKKKIDELEKGKRDDAGDAGDDAGGGEPVDSWTPEPYDRYHYKGYTVDLTTLSNGVRWRVWASTQPPTDEPAASQVIHAQIQSTEEDAKIAANAFIDALLDEDDAVVSPHVPVPTPDPPLEGEGAGGLWTPVPEPPKYVVADVSGMFGEQGPGIFASKDCKQIWISNAVDWVAWASPKILHRKEMDPLELTTMLLSEALPGCDFDFEEVTIAGSKPLLDQIAAADDAVLEKFRDGVNIATVASEAAPAEIAAALLMGLDPIPHRRPAFPYRGHHVTINKISNTGWRWKAWRGTRKKGAPNYQGFSLGPDKAASDAMKKINQVLA